MEDIIKINRIARAMGTALISSGVTMVRSAVNEIPITKIDLLIALSILKVDKSLLDSYYQTTSWDNWQKIIEVIYGIIKNFKWEAEVFDCDQRSNLATSLCGLMFKMNTCGGLYCEVFDATTGVSKYLHWANIIACPDGLYLWDLDYGGQTTKITSNTVVLGNNKYLLKGVRYY